MRLLPLASTALITLLLAGCEGDASPFAEAVEIRELNLVSLSVVPPEISVANLVINIGQAVEFGVQGQNTASQPVELSSVNREWQVSDTSVALIDDDGRLVAQANGQVSVSVNIGGLQSDSYSLEVSNAELDSVDSILGEETVERCVPADYQARGLYDDGSVRDLVAVNWTLATDDTGNARVVSSPDLFATLTGLNAGPVTLTASVDGLSLPVTVQVSDSLTAIDISPGTATVEVGDVASFIATGTYSGPAPGSTTDTVDSREIVVTSSADWLITTGTTYASVSNDNDSRGQVTGIASGSSTLAASCGNLSASTQAVITLEESDGSDELSFNRSNPFVLDPDSSGVFLRVSPGSSYSASDQLDNDDLDWEFTRIGTTDAIRLTTNGDNAGFIVPLVTSGEGTVTVTDSDGNSATIDIEVSNN